ncbi:MAG: Hsp70 family protein [Candidatus Binataceae bacterium]
MSDTVRAVGLDFGTTNSAIAVIGADGAPRLAHFTRGATVDSNLELMRSIVFFDEEGAAQGAKTRIAVGNEAIARYLEAGGEGRLVQSLKSFLADRNFTKTDIMGETYSLEDLIAPILIALRESAGKQFGELGGRVVVGRPVRFSAASSKSDEDLAMRRLDIAVRRAGFDDVVFEFEPVAAACDYASRINRDELVLIADFGGGTSDFSLLRLSPRRGGAGRQFDYEILGNDGVALAGDVFDGRIVRHAVAPALGRGSRYRTPYGKVLPVPTWTYAKLERWHQLSLLKAPATMHRLRELVLEAVDPEKMRALVHVIGNDLGYAMFQSVERAKLVLSDAPGAMFAFADGLVAIEMPIAREEFEVWIARELREIELCVDRLLGATGVASASVTTVFLTGGSSFVPAVRRIFNHRFGSDRIRMGNEFTSVVRGLALRAL